MKHVQLLPGVLCKLIILGAPAHRRNDLRKDLRVRIQSIGLGWGERLLVLWGVGGGEGEAGSAAGLNQISTQPTQPLLRSKDHLQIFKRATLPSQCS